MQHLVENRTVERILPIHLAQLLTYLKLSGLSLGLIINWNVILLRDGIQRLVRNHPQALTREREKMGQSSLGTLGVLGVWVSNP